MLKSVDSRRCGADSTSPKADAGCCTGNSAYPSRGTDLCRNSSRETDRAAEAAFLQADPELRAVRLFLPAEIVRPPRRPFVLAAAEPMSLSTQPRAKRRRI